jgi:NTP pyrophosphatase (non-canonical NTP hydrolase)|tara:strand:- start:75 stop:527 length:453 start_codon:yes stop_codon:yes gene_type:complete
LQDFYSETIKNYQEIGDGFMGDTNCRNHDQLARMNQLYKLKEKKHGNGQHYKNLYKLIDNVVGWHHDRNLIEGSTDKDQTLKLLQELGELSDSVCKGNDIRDDIGDMLVVMINIIERNNLTLEDCLEKAWDDIKDRKGRMIDGIFVKSED